jgi:ADP-heptose:LPS heptosyltransferase
MAEQTPPCISHEQFLAAKKLLIIGSVAIGDFVYLQKSFKALRAAYPHLQIDLWLHDPRATSWVKRLYTRANLKKYVVAEWIETSGIFDITYVTNYSHAKIQDSIKAAQHQEYDLVITGYSSTPHTLIQYARAIAPKAFIVTSMLNHNIRNPFKRFWRWFVGTRHANATFKTIARDSDTLHISEIYAQELYAWSGVIMTKEEQRPQVEIPEAWKSYGQLKLLQWGIPHHQRHNERIVFINIFAKGAKRCWPLNKALELISALQTNLKWCNAHFVLNAEPHQLLKVEAAIKKGRFNRVHTFSAQKSFYQLPAVLEQMDLVISVDTSIVHIASVFDRPIIDLILNRAANFIWRPYNSARSRLVVSPSRYKTTEITVDQVVKAVESLDFTLGISVPIRHELHNSLISPEGL